MRPFNDCTMDELYERAYMIEVEDALESPELYEVCWIDPGSDWEAIEKVASISDVIARSRAALPDHVLVDERDDRDALLDFICIHWAYVRKVEEPDMRCGSCNSEMELAIVSGINGERWVCPYCQGESGSIKWRWPFKPCPEKAIRLEGLEKVYKAARTYVALRNESGYDVQRERTAAWDHLRVAVRELENEQEGNKETPLPETEEIS